MDISKIDINFAVKKYISEGYEFFNARQEPFKIYGLMHSEDKGEFHRLPYELAGRVNDGVRLLHLNTSGGRVRFKTDSPRIAIKCLMKERSVMGHMTHVGSLGFSLYQGGKFHSAFVPPVLPDSSGEAGYDGVTFFEGGRVLRDITIYFPLYNGVSELFIGLEKGAVLKKSRPYKHQKPVVFYGSSITQGGCASRPGNSYDAIVCRNCNADFINLGFSGNCKAEPEMAEYISSLDCSVFVYDYDHNAPDIEHLEKTHFALYQKFRSIQPHTPVMMLSKPDFDNNKAINFKRRQVIIDSYKRGTESGDKNLYFIDGETLFKKTNRDCCTVDGCHPNDLGFERMAQTVYPLLSRLLKKGENL